MEAGPSHQTTRCHIPKHTNLNVSKIIPCFLSEDSGPSNPYILFRSTVLWDQLPHFSSLFAYWLHLFTFSSRKSCHKSSSHLNLGLGVFIVTFWLGLKCFLNHFCWIHSDYMLQTPQSSTKRLNRLPNASNDSQKPQMSPKRLNGLPNTSNISHTPQSSTNRLKCLPNASIVYQPPQVSQTPQSTPKRLICLPNASIIYQTPQSATKRLKRLPKASIDSQTPQSSSKLLNRLQNASIVSQTPPTQYVPRSLSPG
jgi:hypothetical protein